MPAKAMDSYFVILLNLVLIELVNFLSHQWARPSSPAHVKKTKTKIFIDQLKNNPVIGYFLFSAVLAMNNFCVQFSKSLGI